jgi:hypothetical protein
MRVLWVGRQTISWGLDAIDADRTLRTGRSVLRWVPEAPTAITDSERMGLLVKRSRFAIAVIVAANIGWVGLIAPFGPESSPHPAATLRPIDAHRPVQVQARALDEAYSLISPGQRTQPPVLELTAPGSTPPSSAAQAIRSSTSRLSADVSHVAASAIPAAAHFTTDEPSGASSWAPSSAPSSAPSLEPTRILNRADGAGSGSAMPSEGPNSTNSAAQSATPSTAPGANHSMVPKGSEEEHPWDDLAKRLSKQARASVVSAASRPVRLLLALLCMQIMDTAAPSRLPTSTPTDTPTSQ